MENTSDLTRKTNKTRRETAVQGTNDSSIVSKCSTSACGYFNDPFLHYFVSKHSRRAPLIHRGYYIRAVAFDRLLKNFLELNKHSKKQIISLGCGFDSSYFRLKAAQQLGGGAVFFEIDFPELVKKKRLLIENTEELVCLLEKISEPSQSPHIEMSCADYHLLGVDLTQLNTLEAALKMCGVEFNCPTLLLSECVMTYMTRRCSTELVKWAAETFEEAVFGMYEQMNPEDAFGLFMQNHFHSIGSPLKCINAFPTLESQRKRFLNTGWAWCEVLDMNTYYYNHIPTHERQRIEHLETFDEYEELNLKYSHYFILAAATIAPSRSLLSDDILLTPEMRPCQAVADVLTVTRLPEDDQLVRRFGHASSLVGGQHAVISGGFGEIDGRHQRLTEITVTDMKTFKSCHVLCCSTEVQCSRMHHASVSLSDGSTFLIGGRQSPYFMCSQMLKVKLFTDTSHTHSAEQADDQKQQACWYKNSEKHRSLPSSTEHRSDGSHIGSSLLTASILESRTSESRVPSNSELNMVNQSVRTCAGNGCDDSNCDKGVMCGCHAEVRCGSLLVCSSCDMGRVHISVVDQRGSVPTERWRHAATDVILNGQEKIFMHGGKTKSGDILEDSFLFDPVESRWEQLLCSGDSPGPLHSHCVSHWAGQIILTGGLNEHSRPSSDVFVLNLYTRVWQKLNIAGNIFPRYSHTAHLVQDDKLLLIGGVNLHHPPPGLAVVSLRSRQATEFALPEQDKSSLLMFHRHTSLVLDQDTIVLLGGGGNCFSFGTHLNRTPVILNVGACVGTVQ